MGLTVAAEPFEMDRGVHFPPAGLVHCVAGLVRSLIDAKTFATKHKHFRHKWQALEPAILIQRGQDFRFGADFNEASG